MCLHDWLRSLTKRLSTRSPGHLRNPRRRYYEALPCGPAEVLEVRSLLSAGALDLSFGTNGTQLVAAGTAVGAERANSMDIYANGKIIIAGSATGGVNGADIALTELNADGSVNTRFGTNGHVVLDIAGGRNDQINAVTFDASESRNCRRRDDRGTGLYPRCGDRTIQRQWQRRYDIRDGRRRWFSILKRRRSTPIGGQRRGPGCQWEHRRCRFGPDRHRARGQHRFCSRTLQRQRVARCDFRDQRRDHCRLLGTKRRGLRRGAGRQRRHCRRRLGNGGRPGRHLRSICRRAPDLDRDAGYDLRRQQQRQSARRFWTHGRGYSRWPSMPAARSLSGNSIPNGTSDDRPCARLNTNGTVDSSFSAPNGTASATFNSGGSEVLRGPDHRRQWKSRRGSQPEYGLRRLFRCRRGTLQCQWNAGCRLWRRRQSPAEVLRIGIERRRRRRGQCEWEPRGRRKQHGGQHLVDVHQFCGGCSSRDPRPSTPTRSGRWEPDLYGDALGDGRRGRHFQRNCLRFRHGELYHGDTRQRRSIGGLRRRWPGYVHRLVERQMPVQ